MKKIREWTGCEAGVTLIELLVVIVLMSLTIGGVTGLLISSMKAQQKIDTRLRAQLDAREAIYDMESNLAEAKRKDSLDNQPVFQADLVSFPSQNGDNWITYAYAQPPGASGPTIIRVVTNGLPEIPLTLQPDVKQMVVVGGSASQSTSVDRIADGAVFTYYGADGTQILPDAVTHTILTPREVRSVKVSFQTILSEGHTQDEPMISTTQINLRNF